MTFALQPPPRPLCPGSRVVAYVRDSGGDAQEQSIPQQVKAIAQYCQQHNLALEQVFADEAITAGSAQGRHAFHAMLDLLQTSPAPPAGVLIWNFARFARELDDAAFYKGAIRRRGIHLHSLTDIIPDGEHGRVIEAIIDFTNAEKLRQTSRDVKRALRQLAEAGFSTGGCPPVGYLAEKVALGARRDGAARIASRWVIDPDRVDDVRLAWNLRAAGASYAQIQAATGGRLFTTRNSWGTFFTNKTYLGIGKCGGLEIPNHHPAIIDPAVWDAVQDQQNAHPSRRQVGHPNHPRRKGSPALLSGVARCAHCGAAMVYGRGAGPAPWAHYRCGSKQRRTHPT